MWGNKKRRDYIILAVVALIALVMVGIVSTTPAWDSPIVFDNVDQH